MSVLKDVEGRLTEAESQAADLIRRLEGLKALEQSLGNAVQGLDKTSANIGEFASEAGTAAKSLNDTLETLRQAVEILRRSDPAKIHEELTKIGAQLESAAAQAAKIEADSAEFQKRLLSQLSDTTEKLAAEIRSAQEAAVGAIIQRLGEQLKDIAGQAAKIETGNAEFQDRLLAELSGVSEKLAAEIRSTQETASGAIIQKLGEQLKDIAGQAAKIETGNAEFQDRLLAELSGVSEKLATEIRSTQETAAGAIIQRLGEQLKGIAAQAAKIETGNAEFQKRLGSELSGVSEKLAAEIRSAQEATAGAVKTSRQETRAAIEDAQREQSEAIKSVKAIGSITLVLVLVFVCAWVYCCLK